ncbi:MAG: hypothetical protein IKB93_13255 [Clostridia bacterium]|nr:hypothetical protein [Clostridia bacterium]
MKTRKSIFSAILISLLVLAMLPTAAFAETVTSITVNSGSSVSGSSYFSVNMNSVLSQGGIQIYETEFTFSSGDTKIGGWFSPNSGGKVYNFSNFYPVLWNGSNLLLGSTGTGSGTTNNYGTATAGEKYHVLCVVNVVDVDKLPGTMDVYINGVLVADDMRSLLSSQDTTNTTGYWRRLDISKTGVDYATLSVAPADFDITKYAASATVKSGVENITITGNTMSRGGVSGAVYGNLGISLGKRTEKVTKSTLMNSLDISAGASAVLYAADGKTALGDNDYVENGAVLKITSANAKVVNDYKVAVEYAWPAGALVVDKSNSIWGRTTLNPYPAKGDMVVIDYSCTAPETTKANYAPVRLTNDGVDQYWYPIMFDSGSVIGNVISEKTSAYNERINLGSYTEGEKYHVVSVLRFDENNGEDVKTEARLFINGIEVIPQGKVRVHYYNENVVKENDNYYIKFGAEYAKATITMYKDTTSVADFDYSEYAANAAPKADNGIYVTGNGYNSTVFKNFGITVAKKAAVTVGDFLNSLDIEGTAMLYASSSATEAMAESDTVVTGNVLKITSANGEVVNSYAVTVVDTAAVDVITLTDGTASVKASNSTNKLFIAAYKTENGVTTLQEVKMGSIIGDTLSASLTETEGMTIKAFYWTDALVPIDAE